MWRMRVMREERFGAANESWTPNTRTPPASQDPDEFQQVLLSKTPGHMLEDDIAVDKRKTGIRKWQICTGVSHITAIGILVERFGFLNHLLRDIHADTRGKTLRQRLRQSPHTAPEIQRRAAEIGSVANAGQMTQDDLDFASPSGHELGKIPLTVRPGGIGKNGPKRIALGETFPILLEFVEIHRS